MKSIKVLLLLLLVSSCASIRVNYDYDKQTNFNTYKTYNYYSDLETGLSELDTKRLLDIMDANLKAKGFSLSEKPDFFINIQSTEYQNQQRNNVGVGVGGGGGHVGGGLSVGIPIGQPKMNRQITIDFIDENGKGLFWQAVSESGFNPKASPEKREAIFKAIVDKVLSQYPPQQKK
ncbi:hypothetical protein MNBD_BACTEROID02-991 [hydrothermal vent metagenome]|uniref:DUF4136 domain-containing protein n=1 Tax=hydrothermal vent metagenome TaxID=652676 RepID=A0A3B0QRQ2_9ZZZZ